MNKGFLNVKKFLANVAASVIFWDKKKRDSLRYKLSPVNARRCVKYLSRYTQNVEPEPLMEVGSSRYIWMCWLQGVDNAPEIVKTCIQSVIENKPSDYQLVVITKDNFADYVALPDFIIEKHEKNIISMPHFSDILRLYLLYRYGGFWIDATCLLSSELPERICNSDFFLYRSFGVFERTFINNCFIHAKAGNRIVGKWIKAMVDYWRKEKITMEYFVHHYVFISLLENDAEFRSLFEACELTQTDENMHLLYNKAKCREDIDSDYYAMACEKSFIHKLTYKFEFTFLLD